MPTKNLNHDLVLPALWTQDGTGYVVFLILACSRHPNTAGAQSQCTAQVKSDLIHKCAFCNYL